ncbi:MAG: CopD family protein [Gammaproteobacteria bacterium]|nr:CopD family protein [Gammaproteobacteria bacterium]
MLWLKVFHLLFVMAWLTGIFYLPRIFVHYAEGRAAGEDVRRLVIMARRLYGFMTLMALIATLLGVWLMYGLGYLAVAPAWLNWKLLFVAALAGYHLVCRALTQRLQLGAELPGARALRVLNETTLLLVLPILIFVIVKPSG